MIFRDGLREGERGRRRREEEEGGGEGRRRREEEKGDLGPWRLTMLS